MAFSTGLLQVRPERIPLAGQRLELDRGMEGLTMDISAGDGSSFHLKLVGYQFPEKVNEEWDSNWLIIYIAMNLPQGAWSVTDPFLLTYEVRSLADWFDAIASNWQAE